MYFLQHCQSLGGALILGASPWLEREESRPTDELTEYSEAVPIPWSLKQPLKFPWL